MKLCNFDVGLNHPLFLIAGPCVIESEGMTLDVAGQLKEITAALNIPFVFSLQIKFLNLHQYQNL